MKYLTNFAWKGILFFKNSSSFHILSKGQSLENILFKLNYSSMLIDKYFFFFFNLIISLCKAKPNTKIVIKIPKQSEDDEKLIDYKKLCEDVKHPHRLIMELKYFNVQSIILYNK